MRKIGLALLAATCLYFACKKESKGIENSDPDLIGHWIWENSIGGFSGFDTILPRPNSFIILSFKPDSSFSLKQNDRLISEGTYGTTMAGNDFIIKLDNYFSLSGPWLQHEALKFTVLDGKLELTDFSISEPYVHNFTFWAVRPN